MDIYTEIKEDNRVIRVEYSDYDTASDIMGEWDRYLSEIGILISPYERGTADYGDEDIATGLDNWEEDYNRISVDLDDATAEYQNVNGLLENCLSQCGWDYSDEDVLDTMDGVRDRAENVAHYAEELATHISNRPDVRVIEFCPYVDLIRYFRVFVDVETFERETLQEYRHKAVTEAVRAFNVAYRGGIFSITVEDDEGNHIDSVGGVTFDSEFPPDDEIRKYVEECM